MKKEKTAALGGALGGILGLSYGIYKHARNLDKFLECDNNNLYIGKGHIRIRKISSNKIELTNVNTGLTKELCLKEGYTINSMLVDSRKEFYRSVKFYLPKIRDYSLEITALRNGRLITNTIWLTGLE